MILHYYAPAVPESYCVGIHNGHGLGSVFARLFSKIAAKTAAKAAARVAKAAGQKALKVAVTRGAQLGKKALNVVKNQGVKVIKEYGKEAISKAGEAAADYALEKINSTSEKAINKGLPPQAIHSIKDTLERGVKSAQTDVTNAALTFWLTKLVAQHTKQVIDTLTRKLKNLLVNLHYLNLSRHRLGNFLQRLQTEKEKHQS